MGAAAAAKEAGKEEFEFGDVFVAVGISHLIANNSLLELLNGQGYKLEVIY